MKFIKRIFLERRTVRLIEYVLILAIARLCAAQAPLRSPWDSINVKLTNAPYPCPRRIHLSPNLTTSGFYTDSKASIISPAKWAAYQKSSGPVKRLGNEAVAAADAYQTTGSRAAAECVLTLEKTAAIDKALTGKMSSNQASEVLRRPSSTANARARSWTLMASVSS